MAAFDYANCVIHLRADNTGSSTVIDEINGSSAWTLTGATQTATSAIAGAGSFEFNGNNNRTKRVQSTATAVLNALTFSTSVEWVVRFKFRATSWTDTYSCVLGSGPGNPVFTFSGNGDSFNIANYSWSIPGGVPTTGTAHEIEISRTAGRLYAFYDGALLNAGGDAHTEAYATQTEWNIACQTVQTDENFDGLVDEMQVFKGVGGHTASYTPAITTPFPGGSSDVTLALTGVEGTAAVGTLSPAVDKALTNNVGTGSVGTVVQSRTNALTNNVGTGAVGTLLPDSAIGTSGNQATASVGDVTVAGTPDVTIALTGVEATGAAGDAADSLDVALSGVSGTASVGDVAASVAMAVSGSTATASAGSVAPDASVGLSGAQGDSTVGDVTAVSGANADLTGVQGDGAPGDVGVSVTIALSGVEGVGLAGDVALPGSGAAGGYDQKKKQKRFIEQAVQAANEAIAAEQAEALQVAQMVESLSEYDDDEEVLMLLL